MYIRANNKTQVSIVEERERDQLVIVTCVHNGQLLAV